MKIYLDSSALNRIFDDQTQPRIYWEASAMLLIFAFLEHAKLTLISSVALQFESGRNPYLERRLFVQEILGRATDFLPATSAVVQRAQQIERQGIKPLDALHLACAESAYADAFITCDDKLLKTGATRLAIKTPPQFVLDLSGDGAKSEVPGEM